MPTVPGRDVAMYTSSRVLSPGAWADFADRVRALVAEGQRARAQLLCDSVLQLNHVGQHPEARLSVEGFVITQFPCTELGCQRCIAGYGGFRFPWVGSWTRRGTLAQELRRAVKCGRPTMHLRSILPRWTWLRMGTAWSKPSAPASSGGSYAGWRYTRTEFGFMSSTTCCGSIKLDESSGRHPPRGSGIALTRHLQPTGQGMPCGASSKRSIILELSHASATTAGCQPSTGTCVLTASP